MHLSMRTLLIALVILVAPRLASAGLMCDEPDGFLSELEAAVKTPAKTKDISQHWHYCLGTDLKRKPRVVAACTVIASRFDTKEPMDPDAHETWQRQELCLRALAGFGVNPIKTKTKEVDYLGQLLAKKFPMSDDPSYDLDLLTMSKDPRVLPKLLEVYGAHVATATKTPPRGWRAENWIRWHRSALAAIGALGTKADLAFLDEVRVGSKDKRVHAWVDAAKKAIESR